jgi:hypothetical protein
MSFSRFSSSSDKANITEMIQLKRREEKFSDVQSSAMSALFFIIICVEQVSILITESLNSHKDKVIPLNLEMDFVRKEKCIEISQIRKLTMFIYGFEYISSTMHLSPTHKVMFDEISQHKFGPYYDAYMSFSKIVTIPGSENIVFKSKFTCNACF